jgi:phenylacetaldehyde dehydrogenase
MKTLASSHRASARPSKPVQSGKRSTNGHGEISSAHPAVSPHLTAWLSKPRLHLINGRWVPSASGKTFDVFNPADGSLIARVAEGDKEDINRAVAAARKRFASGPWHGMTPRDRGKLLWRIGDLILQAWR